MGGRGLLISVLAGATLAVPAAAGAATFTVDPGAPAGCTAARVCHTISEANAAVADGDVVEIKQGTFTEPGPIVVARDNVTFKAVPAGAVSVSSSSPTAGAPTFTLGAGTRLDGLVVGVPATGGPAVLVKGPNSTVIGSTLARLTANTVDAPVYQVDPAVASGTNQITDSFVAQTPSGTPQQHPPAIAGNATSSLGIAGSAVLAGDAEGPAVALIGNDENADGTPIANAIVRSTIYASRGDQPAISFLGGATSAVHKALRLDSVLISGGSGAAGLVVKTATGSLPGSDTSGDIRVDGVHVTIAGSALPYDVEAASSGLTSAQGSIAVNLDRSIIHGAGPGKVKNFAGLALIPANTAKVTLTASDTATPNAALFFDPAKRDFHLRADAPVIDKAGDITPGGSTKDLDGDPRVSGAASDTGADEFVNRVPVAALRAAPAAPAVGQTVTFDASPSVDPESGKGGSLATYRWTFGDGATQETTTPAVQHAYAKPGAFGASLVVVDNFGAVSAPSAPLALSVRDPKAPTVHIASPTANQKIHLTITTTTKKRVKGKDGKKHKKTTRRTVPRPIRFGGTTADADGIRSVELALRRVSVTKTPAKKKTAKKRAAAKKKTAAKAAATSCAYLGATGFTSSSCAKPTFFAIGFKDGVFSYRIPSKLKLRPGVYALSVRATDTAGNVSAPVTVRFRLV